MYDYITMTFIKNYINYIVSQALQVFDFRQME